MNAGKASLPILLVLLVFGVPSVLLAQSETGTITGTVTDQSGAVVPGVTVTLTSAAIIGGTRSDVTSAIGAYKFIALPPGSYDLKFELSGFRTVSREGIRITANFVAKVDMALSMQALAETVTVSGEAPTVDSKSTLIATSLDKGLLDNIPTGRDIWVLTEQVAGTVPDRYNVGGTESAQQTTLAVHGAYAQQDYSVNGLSMNWPGGAGNYTMFYFDYDSFEEVQVETAGAPAEISVGGLYMNMITKSGGSEFHGGFTGMWNPGSLQGNNVSQEMTDKYGIKTSNPIDQIYDLQPYLGGPIRKNIWFFGSYRRYVINTQILGLTRPDGSPEVDVNHQTNALAKVTAQVNPANKVMAQYYFNYQNRFYRRDNGYAYTEEKASWRQIEPAHLIQGQWTSVLKKSLFLDMRFGYLHQVFPLEYQTSVGSNDISMIDDVLSTVKNAAPNAQSNLATRHQANVSLTYFKDRLAGTHDFKFGFEWMRALNGYNYWQNGSLAEHFYNGVPAYVDATNLPMYQESRIHNTSFYAQDAWAVNNRLTLNLGVRFENFKGSNPAQGADAGRFFPARQYPEMQDIPNFSILVPRLGVSYDVKGDGRTAIKASFSRYAIMEGSRFPETLNPNAYSGQGMEWTDTNHDNIAQDSELGAILYRYGGASGITLDQNISRPYSDEITAGVQHQLGTDLAVSATYYYRKNKNLLGQLNLAAPMDTAFFPVVESIPGAGSITVYNEKPEFVGQVSRQITNQTQFWESYNGIEFTAKKRLSSRWQMLLGYTYSKAKSYYVEVPWNFYDSNDPNNLINIDGRVQASDTPNILKLGGTYILPYDIQLSGNYRYYTGKPLTRTFLVTDLNQGPVNVPTELRGTYRYPNVSLLDFRVSKVFAMSKGVKLEAMFDLFNAFNAGTVINQVTTYGPSFGQPVQLLTPIVVGFGARLTF
jgi:hypothetical protein